MWVAMDQLAETSLHRHAAENLRFIRDTMARASGFTAVPGWGGALMGVTAVATAVVAGPPEAASNWLRWWLWDAALAFAIGIAAMARKARRVESPIGGAAGRRFALALVPTLAAGAILTVVFVRYGLTARLPGCWLLMYGAAVSSAGSMSVPPVPIMGVAVLLLGAVAFALPMAWGNVFMALGFGLMHIICGIVIARRYGG